MLQQETRDIGSTIPRDSVRFSAFILGGKDDTDNLEVLNFFGHTEPIDTCCSLHTPFSKDNSEPEMLPQKIQVH
jgi:hypothetical protein